MGSFSLTLLAKCQRSKVSIKKPNHLNGIDEKRGVDAEEKEGQASGSERDDVNDPSAANTG